MKNVIVRNVVIGDGIPKICVPIVEKEADDIFRVVKEIMELPIDIVEWRADWYEHVFDQEKMVAVLKELRTILGDTPLLFTFRTAEEGGERAVEISQYGDVNHWAAESGFVDLIDVEAFRGKEIVELILYDAHQHGVKVVGSNHDFYHTPSQYEIVKRLRLMQELGVDIPKIAVMPKNKQDVLTLLAATEEMYDQYADRPIITMSMSGEGVISRLCGEVFGSAVTFGSAGKASAPGQMDVEELREMLTILHRNL